MKALTETHLSGARLLRRGKIRDIYDLGNALLLVATDRISAFDVVLSPGIPDKGKIVTQMSVFWFQKFADVENQLIETDAFRFPESLLPHAELLAGRSLMVRKTEVVPFECVARGFLAGSGWAEYRKRGTVCGIPLPAGLHEAARLAEPIFTPATKSEKGHDENVPFEAMTATLGEDLARELREKTLSLYARAREYAESRGIILADTKLEFGRLDGQVIWIDEAFTPDSSRFWPASSYQPGRPPLSFDKQFVRDWLESTGWDKHPPSPHLPEGVVKVTRVKYLEAFRLLVGRDPEHLSG